MSMGRDIKWNVHSARRYTKLIQVNFLAFTLFSHIYPRIMLTTTNISANNSNSNLSLHTVHTTSTRVRIHIKEAIILTKAIRKQILHQFILQDIRKQLTVSATQTRKWSISVRQTKPSSVHGVYLRTRETATLCRSAGWTSTELNQISQTWKVSIRDW